MNHTLFAADLVDRLPELARDSKVNAEAVITRLAQEHFERGVCKFCGETQNKKVNDQK